MSFTKDQHFVVQDDDKYVNQNLLTTQQNSCDINIETIGTHTVGHQSSQPNEKQLSNISVVTEKCFLIFVLLLLIIGLGVLTGASIIRSDRFTKKLKMKEKIFFEEQTKNYQSMEHLNSLRSIDNQSIQQLTNQLKISVLENTKKNQRVEQLNGLRSIDNQTIERLTNQLKESPLERTKISQTIQQLDNLRSIGSQTIQQLTNQLKESIREKIKNDQRIEQLNNLRSIDNQTIQRLTNQLKESIVEKTKNNQTIQHLINQLQKLRKENIRLNKTRLTVVENKEMRLNKTTDAESTQELVSIHHPRIGPHTQWIQNGITVATSYQEDNGVKSLLNPFGFDIDDDQTVVIADYFSHRIVEWKPGATSGQVVAGGNKQGNRTDQLNFPTDVIIDKQTEKLIICDSENRQVTVWPRRNGTSGEIIISQIKCFGLAMDDQRFLYVSDLEKHEVRRWRIGETQETLVAGGHGPGDRLDQLNSPQYIFVDHDHSVYVSDSYNHRVIKWMKDTKEGIIVAGGQGVGNALTQLSSPEGVFVDQYGSVYVADSSNHRIMRWMKGATQGTVIVGENGYGGRINQFYYPMGLSFDLDGNLYVADYNNHRIQKFDVVQSLLE